MNLAEIFLPISLVWLSLNIAESARLSEYVKHFEGLDYNSEIVHQKHERARRSTRSPTIHLDFNAHGRRFNVRLRRDTSTFSQDFAIEQSDNSLVYSTPSHIYEGELKGEPQSKVHGSIINGVFAGKISTADGNYHIERSDFYFNEPQGFHSVIYHEKDIDPDPHRQKRAAELGTCGNDNVKAWMSNIQHSAIDHPEVNVWKRSADLRQKLNFHRSSIYNMYSKEAQEIHREKREVSDKKTCVLFLQSDTMLWERMVGSKDMGGLGFKEDRAKEEITSLFADHVKGINDIYENTVFKTEDDKFSYKGINFVVRRVKINETNKDCHPSNSSSNFFCEKNIDVSNFLNLNSLRNHDEFCLAYVFTYRDFTGGTLGLAWVGSPSKASGGICEKWKEYQENTNRVWKSLNTGIVTLINYNSPVPPQVSTLTFAHEVGHNFGSPHDSGDQCTPFSAATPDPDGNYIMYASATSGDRPNNNKFSSCSKDNITRVLDAVFNESFGKRNCFEARQSAFCGNNIVEQGEACDCGYMEDCKDQCCYGRGDSGKQCQLREHASCSPSQGPCCFSNCSINPNPMICAADSDCNDASKCNGVQPVCPKPAPKRNETTCNGNTQICINGECQKSICHKISWEQCFLTAPEGDKSFDKSKLCYVACQKSIQSGCISTGDNDELNKAENSDLKKLLTDLRQDSIKLPPGAPCNEFKGYCDVFQKCRDVDADGPLARLKKLLFNEKTFNDIRNWIIKYWWAVLLMGVALIVFMGIFIKVCAVHTPSSNPKKPPPRKLTLRPQPRNQGPPPPYPGPSRGGPPHGKGRGRTHYEMQPRKV